jgi:eukaryotic-like serine/threonine-protein kinase
VANGVVYIGSTNGKVYALNAATGAKLWIFTTGASVYSSPAVVNGMVYVGSNDGNLYAFGLPGGTATVKRPAPGQLHPTTPSAPGRPEPGRDWRITAGRRPAPVVR